MINHNDLRHVIEESLVTNDLPWSESAVVLLQMTANHESLGGMYLRQVNGPAIGIYQMEPWVIDDCMKHCTTPFKFLRYRWSNDRHGKFLVVSDLETATCIARAQYYRFSEALPEPGDYEGMARYWKKYWNTELGKGTVEKFLKDNEGFIEWHKTLK